MVKSASGLYAAEANLELSNCDQVLVHSLMPKSQAVIFCASGIKERSPKLQLIRLM